MNRPRPSVSLLASCLALPNRHPGSGPNQTARPHQKRRSGQCRIPHPNHNLLDEFGRVRRPDLNSNPNLLTAWCIPGCWGLRTHPCPPVARTWHRYYWRKPAPPRNRRRYHNPPCQPRRGRNPGWNNIASRRWRGYRPAPQKPVRTHPDPGINPRWRQRSSGILGQRRTLRWSRNHLDPGCRDHSSDPSRIPSHPPS